MSQKASEIIRYIENMDGPVIGTVKRAVIEKDGLYFKDIAGDGEFHAFDDWRLPAKERARALVKEMTVQEKIGQLFVADWRMGIHQKDETKRDATGLLDEAEVPKSANIFISQDLPGTTDAMKNWFTRHYILRANPAPSDLADWINQMQATAEDSKRFVPVLITSNSRNEKGEMVFGMNDAAGVFPSWPGTLGISAAILGSDISLIDRFADCVRRDWNAVGIKKGYMYMADTVTDPRWQRTYGAFGENPELIREIFSRLVPIIQGSEEGVTKDGVAMTVKHFPGGGARENGFDPHYSMGQWNIYPTEGSLEKYHLPAFYEAISKNTSSIMPYYAKPSSQKSAKQATKAGNEVKMEPYGFAFNRYFIDGLLRNEMGFNGYVNSDSGIIGHMCWGVEKLDEAERIALAVSHAGVDIISGSFNIDDALEAYARGKNDYYDTHPVPDGFTREQVVLTDEALDRAVMRTLTEMFEMGLFENPYRDPELAEKVIANESDWQEAMRVHEKSVTLLKNDGCLPIRDRSVKVYAECFHKEAEKAVPLTKELREALKEYACLTDDSDEADYAVLFLSPSSGAYFSATPGYLELEIAENKTVCDVDEAGRPSQKTHLETTLTGVKRIYDIASRVHARGGKVIGNINVTLAWEVGSVEPVFDALLCGYSTEVKATLGAIFGSFAPTGRLPVTLPRNDEVLRVDENGVCISPNDVPGYDKDKYMPDCMKDENGKAYAYRDKNGNYYEYGFGLGY